VRFIEDLKVVAPVVKESLRLLEREAMLLPVRTVLDFIPNDPSLLNYRPPAE